MPTTALVSGVPTLLEANTAYAIPVGPYRLLANLALTFSTTVGGVYAALTGANAEPGVLVSGGFIKAAAPATVVLKKTTKLGTYAGLVAQANPTAYWRLGEQSGNVLYDSFGNYNLAKGSSVVLGVAGATGDGNYAVTLDGTINGIGSTSSGAAPQAGQSAISFEAWVNNPAWAAGHEMILSIGSIGIYLSVDTGGLTMSIHTGSQLVSKAVPVLSTAAWNHVAGTWESGDRIRLYINGALVVGDNNTTRTGTLSAAINLFLGAFNGTSLFYSGTVDEVAFFLRKLTAAEIAEHYAARTFI